MILQRAVVSSKARMARISSAQFVSTSSIRNIYFNINVTSANTHISLRLALLLAAFACILRPTNGLIWLAISIPTFWRASGRLRYVLVREILICG